MCDQRLTAEGIFDRLVDGLHIGGGRVGDSFVQSFVKLSSQSICGNRATNGYLHECSGDAVKRRSGLDLRQAEVHLWLGGVGNIALLHVSDDTDDMHLRESPLAHKEGVAEGVLAWKVLVDERLVHDHDRRSGGSIVLGKEPAAQHGNAKRFDKVRRGQTTVG